MCVNDIAMVAVASLISQLLRAIVLEHVLIRKAKKARTRCFAPSADHHMVCGPVDSDGERKMVDFAANNISTV